MVVSIPIRVEDNRQRSWLVDVPDVPLAEIAALVKAVPRTHVSFWSTARASPARRWAERTAGCRRTT